MGGRGRFAPCPNCGFENPEGFSFCGACGRPLPQERSAQVEERKLVSILFVDLVGFTAYSHGADPEDIRAALSPYYAVLKREIERFGGTVEKFIGDAVMAVFGAPVAHEDDAERAVRAALRITEAIEELNDSLALELSIRAAVNTGEGLVTLSARPQLGEAIVTGDVVNTASRLQGVAPVNGVVVGEITHRATKGVVEYEALDDVAVKGKPKPIPVWKAMSARGRFGIDLDRAPTTPIIGREHEVGLLRSTFRRTLKESSIQLVTIVGEPGVGKSRLLSEFFSFLDDQEEIIFFRQGRSLPYGEGISFWALGEIVKGQSGILESDTPEVAADKLRIALETSIGHSPEHEWFFARLAPLVGAASHGAGGAEREESFTAWRRFLEAIARRAPLVLVFEDLHWADAAMLEFIEYLVESSTEASMLVLCTARPELFDMHSGWGAVQRNTATVSLSPLGESETAQLISALLSQAVLPEDVHSALLERAGGNPLYAVEFIRMLTDRGILQRRGRVVTLTPQTDFPMPETLQALIAARLDALAPVGKALLHDAAVVGKVFWSGALAAIGEIDIATVSRGLHELVRRELVRAVRNPSMEGEQEYAFRHVLLRDVCYSQIPKSARIAKHKAMAAWLEGIAGARVSDHAEVLAHHYTQALDLARAGRRHQEGPELVELARRFLVMAGDRTLHLDAAKAETYYRRTLELTPEGHEDRGRVLLKGGEAAELLGSFSQSQRYIEDALSEFRRRGDLLGAGEALTRLAFVMWSVGDTLEARRIWGQAIELLEKGPRSRELCYAYATHAIQRVIMGAPAEALELADKALTLATSLGDEEQAVRAQTARGVARFSLGHAGAQADLEEALRKSLVLGHSKLIAEAYTNLGWSVGHSEPRRALDLSREGIEFAARRGLTADAVFMEMNAVSNLYSLGEWDESLRLSEAGIRWAVEHRAGQVEAFGLAQRACVLLHRGYLDEAASVEERLLELAREIGDPQTLVPSLMIAATIRAASSDTGAAVSLVQEMAESTEGNTEGRIGDLPEATRVLVAAGRLDLAATIAPEDSEVHTVFGRHAVVTARAILAEANGSLVEALALYDDATDRWRAYGFVLEEGHALLGAGRCLLGVGRRGEASARLRAAREIFTKLQARLLLGEVDSHLQKAGQLSS